MATIKKSKTRELMDKLGPGFVREHADIYKVRNKKFLGFRIQIRGEWVCTVYDKYISTTDAEMANRIAEFGFDVLLKSI